jgi:hypothetical protein
MTRFARCFVLTILSLAVLLNATANAKGPTYTDPANADADFAVQGEYTGDITTQDGTQKVGLQVIALGEGKFDAFAYLGGLPGDGWSGTERYPASGETKAGVTVLGGDNGRAEIRDGVAVIYHGDDREMGKLKRVIRESATLGAEPPEGAVVLFDGSTAEHFQRGRLTDDGLLMQGATSHQKFGSCRLHLEFRTPYQPQDRGQARGNSGCYLQGRYEVQVLDSFGLEGKHNECGGIYSIKDPDVNMCYPPLVWQTYDIDYTQAQYDGAGNKTARARITVRHNGVVIHQDVELPHATTAAPVKAGPEPGPVYLQDHGNPVRYRNIWVVEK